MQQVAEVGADDEPGNRAARGAHLGLIGLAVMGQNLVLNMNDHGFDVAVYNRSTERTDAFLAGRAAGTRVIGTRSSCRSSETS